MDDVVREFLWGEGMKIEGTFEEDDSTQNMHFDGSMLFYKEDTIFRLLRSQQATYEVSLLLRFLNILREGLPEMNPSFLYRAVFSEETESLLYVCNGKVIGGMVLKLTPSYVRIDYMAIDKN